MKLAGEPDVRLDATTSNGNIVSRLPPDAATTETRRLRGAVGRGETDLIEFGANHQKGVKEEQEAS